MKIRSVDSVSLVDIVASGQLTGGEPFGHASAPGHESQGDENCSYQSCDCQENTADDVNER